MSSLLHKQKNQSQKQEKFLTFTKLIKINLDLMCFTKTAGILFNSANNL